MFNWPVLAFDEAINHQLVLSAIVLALMAMVLAQHRTMGTGQRSSTEQDADGG